MLLQTNCMLLLALQSYISQRVSAEQECPLDFNGGSSSFVGDNDAPVSIGSHYGSGTELDRVDRSMLPICSYSSGDGSSDEFFDADVLVMFRKTLHSQWRMRFALFVPTIENMEEL